MKTEISAFISTSIRPQDKSFCDKVENEVKKRGIHPFGTVGLHHVSPEPVVKSIHDNIQKADLVVVCLTPRYNTKDIHNSKLGYSGSEAVQNEIGIAVGMQKPIIAFVQKGCNPGELLKGVTQYIELDNSEEDFYRNSKKVDSLFSNAMTFAGQIAQSISNKKFWSLAVGALAIFGFINLFSEE